MIDEYESRSLIQNQHSFNPSELMKSNCISQLIFLPGASGSRSFWVLLIEHLSNYSICEKALKNVIAYPEFDGDPPHPEVNSFHDLQDYVLKQIQEPSIVIAQSMGGIFAVQAALQKPKDIQALVLIATSGGIDLSPFDVADWRQNYQKQFQVPSWFVDHQQSLDDELHQIQCPILLIWGDDDSISPVAVGQYLKSKFKYAQLYIIEHGQHDLANVYASEVGVLIAQFVKRHFQI